MVKYKIRMVRRSRVKRLLDWLKIKLSAPRLLFVPRRKILQGIYRHYSIEQVSFEEDVDCNRILRFITHDKVLARKLRRPARDFVEMTDRTGTFTEYLILISNQALIERMYYGKL